jgi:hypothetical protein
VDIIINATSASLSGELPPIAPSLIRARRNLLLRHDVRQGADSVLPLGDGAQGGRAVDGLGMLVEQAAEAFFCGAVCARIRRRCSPNCAANWRNNTCGSEPARDEVGTSNIDVTVIPLSRAGSLLQVMR